MTTVTIPSTITAKFAREQATEYTAWAGVHTEWVELWSAVADALEAETNPVPPVTVTRD